MLPDGTDIAPEEVLRMTKCSCMQSKCDTNACGCKKNGLKCSEFCQCENCYNCEKPISNSTNDMTEYGEVHVANDDSDDSDEDCNDNELIDNDELWEQYL